MNLAAAYSRISDTAFGVADNHVDDDEGELVARGDSRLDEDDALLPSELEGVSDEQWTQFCRRMATANCGDVSASNALGMFELMPRRLADLGLVYKLERGKNGGRTVWLAVFKAPLTADRFLRDPQLQYLVFCQSVKDYDGRMNSGEIDKVGALSKSGAHAILHRAGPSGLKTWSTGERFEGTNRLFTEVDGLF